MPAPADVQAYNGGATIGKAEHNDSITFTFASAVNPALILPGWNGASTTVSIHFQHNSSNDILSVRNDSTGALLAQLGAVEMKSNYTTGNSDFANSHMTASGNTVTVVFGTAGSGVHLRTNTVKAAMLWSTPKGSVTESGVSDIDF
jgi:hypothetical protein